MNLTIFLLKSVMKNGKRAYESFRGGIARDLRYYSNLRVLGGRRVF